MRLPDGIQRNAHTIALVVVACCAGGVLLSSLRQAPQYDDRSYVARGSTLAQRVIRLTRDSTALHDSLKVVEAVRARETIRYVSARRTATDAVEALPAAKLVDTATYVAQLEQTVSAQDVALRSADAVVRSDSVVIQTMQHTIDTLRELAVTNDSTAQNEKARGDALADQQPGFLSRTWSKVKVPLVFAAGIYLGLQVH